MNKKMADIDIDPFEEHELRPEEPTDEHIPLTPVGVGSTWEPECEQEASFGGRESQRNRVLKIMLKVYIRNCLKNGQEPQKYFTTTCLKSEMKNCTSETRKALNDQRWEAKIG